MITVNLWLMLTRRTLIATDLVMPVTTAPEYDYEDELDVESEKKNLAAQIMEKLLEMYYSN